MQTISHVHRYWRNIAGSSMGWQLERLDLDAAYRARTAFEEGVLIAPYDPKPRVGKVSPSEVSR